MKRPLEPVLVRRAIADILNDNRGKQLTEFSPGKQGALIGVLNRIAGDDQNRRVILGFLFTEIGGELSTKQLTVSNWHALDRWIGTELVDGDWIESPHLQAEVDMILDALQVPRQAELALNAAQESEPEETEPVESQPEHDDCLFIL